MEQITSVPPRSFACEQPRGTQLWRLHPWPHVLNHPGVYAVHFDQCVMGQQVQGLPARKPSTLLTDAPEIAHLFEGQLCNGRHHQHADLA
eukprot:4144418-Amphidinium_carterae.1